MSGKSKGRSLYECMGKITVNPTIEEVKIIAIGEAPPPGILFHEAAILGKKLSELGPY